MAFLQNDGFTKPVANGDYFLCSFVNKNIIFQIENVLWSFAHDFIDLPHYTGEVGQGMSYTTWHNNLKS